MHRNSVFSILLVLTAILVLSFCSCSESGIHDLYGLQGVWDYTAKGTVIVGLYSNRAIKGNFSGVYSITPMKMTDRQGYDWQWDYDQKTLQFDMLKTIPIPDSGCGQLIMEGKAKFRMPNMEFGATVANGLMTLENATLTCHNSGKEGPVSGQFSIHMVKRQ